MIICPICNKELPDDARYCDGCGTPFIRDDMCWNCNAFITPGETYCPVCGVAQYAEETPQYDESAYAQQDYYENQPTFDAAPAYEPQPTFEVETPAYAPPIEYNQPEPTYEPITPIEPPAIEQPPFEQPIIPTVTNEPIIEAPKTSVMEQPIVEPPKPPVIEAQITQQTPQIPDVPKTVSSSASTNDIPIKNTIPVQKNVLIQPNPPIQNNTVPQNTVPIQNDVKPTNAIPNSNNVTAHGNVTLQNVVPPTQNVPVQNNIPLNNNMPPQPTPIAQAPSPRSIPNTQNIPTQVGTPVPHNFPVQNRVPSNQVPYYTANPAMKKAQTPRKKKSKKIFIFGGAAVSLLLVVAIVLSMLFFGGNRPNYAVYFKDNDIFYTKTSKINPTQLTSSLIDEDLADELDDDDYSNIGYSLANYITFSNDGKTVFFVDNIDEDSNGATIYYKSVKNQKKDAIKIDSDILRYSINNSANLVTYIKSGDDKILYQHNLKDKEKIASDVSNYFVTDDGKKILYINKEGTMYLKTKGKDVQKVDSNVTDIAYYSNHLKTIYYLKDDVLYKKTDGKDKVKISSDISEVLGIYDSGEIYYTKKSSADLNLINYVDDDLKGSDSLMVEPVAPDYPSYFDYNSYTEYSAAVDQYRVKYDEYTDARSEYYEKLERERLREKLESETLNYSNSSLYYFDGDNELKLTDSLADGEYGLDYEISSASPMLVFPLFEESETEKVKISEIDNISDLKNKVEEALYSSMKYHIAITKTVTPIDCENAEDFWISNDEKAVFFIDNINDDKHGDLYKMTISNKKPKKPELYDSDVYIYSAYMYSDSSIIYYKDVDNDKGELYLNKKFIDSDVKLYNIRFIGGGDGFTYMTDWNSKKLYGTLKKYSGSKVVKISDDVYTYTLTPGDEVLYLCDYNTKDLIGELRLHKGKKSVRVDDDVTAIIPVR